jgi:hypothetical protein
LQAVNSQSFDQQGDFISPLQLDFMSFVIGANTDATQDFCVCRFKCLF